MTTTPAALAQTHAAANAVDRAWSEVEFADLLKSGAVLFGDARSFLLGRIIAGEGEVLTLATHPDHRRQGLAQAILSAFCAQCSDVFLEVAADNSAAIALYHRSGFEQVGTRTNYYARPNHTHVDALVLRRKSAP